jgi:hypothetical protein
MAHFAQIFEGKVKNVIVAEQDVIDSGAFGDPASWKQTSYNGNIRRRFAGIGYEYNEDLDAFIPPKPFPSWILDTENAIYVAPLPRPIENHWIWHEDTLSWVEEPHILPGA